jgi:hypothetical protein
MICAAQQIILNASPGGPFEDLVVLQGKSLAWSAPLLIQAMQDVIAFAVAQARFTRLSNEAATTVGLYAFTLAYTVIKNNKPLSTENLIPASELKGSISTSPSPTTFVTRATNSIVTTSSASLMECLATCTMYGVMKACITSCPTGTDVSAPMPETYAVKTVSIKPWVVPSREQTPMLAIEGSCPEGDTDFPTELFAQTYGEFCTQTDKDSKDLSWIVNADGQQIAVGLKPKPSSGIDEKFSGYQFNLLWKPKASSSVSACSTKCADAYKALADSGSCKRGTEKKNMAASGGIDVGCGQYSYSIKAPTKAPEAAIKCRGHPLSAPKRKDKAGGATSVQDAIETWCKNTKDRTIKKSPSGTDEEVYERFPITQLSVPNRSSFWLRASINDDTSEAKFDPDACKSALVNSLDNCDSNDDQTHGFTATVGSVNYELDLSGVTRDESPPWNEKASFPPPEFATPAAGYSLGPNCYDTKQEYGRKLSDEDLNNAIDAFCVDGAEIKGYGQYWKNMFIYPPANQPQFYNSAHTKMHLDMGVETINNGAPEPYKDMNWCK